MVSRVIKQNVTFRNSSIGVVRADRGGEQLEKDIQNSADSLIKNAFKIANDEAIKKGQELANNLSADQLRAINPETGNLEVLDNSPLLAGLSQRTAFKQVVDKRFRYTLEQDIKQKATELSVKYQNDPKMISKFQSDFNSYLTGLKKPFADAGGVTNEYSGFINDLGESYLASTKVFLTDKKIKRDFAISKKEYADNIVADGEALNSTILAMDPMNIDNGTIQALLTKSKAYTMDNESSGVIDKIDRENTNQAFQGSVYSAFTTHVVDGIRAQYGTKNKYNTYQKIEKTLMNMSEVIDNKGKGLNTLDDTDIVLRINNPDGTSTEYTQRSFVKAMIANNPKVDTQIFKKVVDQAINENINDQQNFNKEIKDKHHLNTVEYQQFTNKNSNISDPNSNVSMMYSSADQGNTANILSMVNQYTSGLDKFAKADDKSAVLKPSGTQYGAIIDSSGVSVKGEVLTRWLRSTGLEDLIRTGNKNKQETFINDVILYVDDRLVTNGNTKLPMPKSGDAKLNKQLETVLGNLDEYYTVKNQGVSLDSLYSSKELNAELKRVRVASTTQQTAITKAEVSQDKKNNENVHAKNPEIIETITEPLETATVDNFDATLNKINGSIKELDQETGTLTIGEGDNAKSYEMSGVDTTIKNHINSNIEDHVARSYVGAVNGMFESQETMSIDGQDRKLADVFANNAVKKEIVNTLQTAITSNELPKFDLGNEEINTYLNEKFAKSIGSINQSQTGIKTQVQTKLKNFNTQLTASVARDNAIFKAQLAQKAVEQGIPNNAISKDDTINYINGKIYGQNQVANNFFATQESLDPNHPATKEMYRLAKIKAFSPIFMSQMEQLLNGQIQDVNQTLVLMQHYEALSKMVTNVVDGKGINAFFMGDEALGGGIKESDKVKLAYLGAYIDVFGINPKSAQDLSTRILRAKELRNERKFAGGDNIVDAFVAEYDQANNTDGKLKLNNLIQVMTHHMRETYGEDSPNVIQRLASVVKVISSYDAGMDTSNILDVADKFYSLAYTKSSGIILDPKLRNNDTVDTTMNINSLIPINELETFYMPPPTIEEQERGEVIDYSHYNGMQKQDVWLDLIQVTLNDKDAMEMYGDMEFILDDRSLGIKKPRDTVADTLNRGRTGSEFDFNNYNPLNQAEVPDRTNIIDYRKANRNSQTADVPVYGTKKAPVKVFLVPMPVVYGENMPQNNGSEPQKIHKFRVMRVSDNGLDLEPINIKTDIGDGQQAFVPFVVSYRGSNDITPLDYLTLAQLQDAHQVRNANVVENMQPVNFTIDDL